LGHFLLTMLLLPQLKRAPSARVVSVASEGHFMALNGFSKNEVDIQRNPSHHWTSTSYGLSKLANIQFMYEFDRRCHAAGLNISAYSCHPGLVFTELIRHFNKFGRVRMCSKYPLCSILLCSLKSWYVSYSWHCHQ
jgi:NAD(P)-dependent dehydrogenase (short-subunit alcohol dehydrogenase family)